MSEYLNDKQKQIEKCTRLVLEAWNAYGSDKGITVEKLQEMLKELEKV